MCHLLDDQTSRLWTWILWRDIFNRPPLLAKLNHFEDLESRVNVLLATVGPDKPSYGVLWRCKIQLHFIFRFVRNELTPPASSVATKLFNLAIFDESLSSTLAYRWLNSTLFELKNLRDNLLNVLVRLGTVPALPLGLHDRLYRCWVCRMYHSNGFNSENGDDDEYESCGHLIYFTDEESRCTKDNVVINDDDDGADDRYPLDHSERIDWVLERRKFNRVKKTRRLVMKEIQVERNKVTDTLRDITSPKLLNISCFRDFGRLDSMICRVKTISDHFANQITVNYELSILDKFNQTLENIIQYVDISNVREKALKKFSTMIMGKDAGEALLKRVLSIDGMCDDDVQRWMRELNEACPLAAIKQFEENVSSLQLLHRVTLFFSIISYVLEVVFPLCVTTQISQSYDTIVFCHGPDAVPFWGTRRNGEQRKFQIHETLTLTFYWLKNSPVPNEATRRLLNF